MDQAVPLPPQSRLQHFTGAAGRMADIGNQVGVVFEHISVCSDNGRPLGYGLHARRIKGAVKALLGGNGLVVGMIGQEQGQRDLWVALFSLPDRTGSQTIKAAVVSHHKIGDAVLCDMLIYRLDQCWADGFACIPVANEKAGAHGAVPPLLPREDVSHGVIQKVIVTSYLLIALLYYCIAIKGNFNL